MNKYFPEHKVLKETGQIERIRDMMLNNGIKIHPKTNRKYFTGYSYNTLFDWDQYFDGILQIYAGIGTEYIRNAVLIFLDSQSKNGFIPRTVRPENLRMKEEETEHVKPFLSQICLLVYRNDKNLDWLDESYYIKLKKSVEYWFREKDPDNLYLPVWESGPHTGMDNHHERAGYWNDSFGRGTDLASYLCRECKSLAQIARIKNKNEDSNLFDEYAHKIKEAVNTYMWSPEEGMYFDIDSRTGKKIPYRYAGTFAPLWAHIADRDKAEILIKKHLLNKDEFWRNYPVSATTATEKNYVTGHAPGDIGCSWRAHTWIPANYFIIHGLMDYGYKDIALDLSRRTEEMVLNAGDWEFYDSENGRGWGLNPFWGWSLLAYFTSAEIMENADPTRI